MTDPVTNAIKSAAILVLVILACILGAVSWVQHARLGLAAGKLSLAQTTMERMEADLAAQKKEARAQLAAANASVLAQQRRLDAAAEERRRVDVENDQAVEFARAELRAVRVQLAAAKAARRGDGGAARPSGDPIGALARAAGGAEAASVLPAPAGRASDADDDLYDADRINVAYASCRDFAMKVQAVLSPAGAVVASPPPESSGWGWLTRALSR